MLNKRMEKVLRQLIFLLGTLFSCEGALSFVDINEVKINTISVYDSDVQNNIDDNSSDGLPLNQRVFEVIITRNEQSAYCKQRFSSNFVSFSDIRAPPA